MAKLFNKFTVGALIIVAGMTLSACKPNYETMPLSSDQVQFDKSFLRTTGVHIADRVHQNSVQFVSGMAAARGLEADGLRAPKDIYYPAAWDAGHAYADRHQLSEIQVLEIASVLSSRYMEIDGIRDEARKDSAISGKRQRRYDSDDIVVTAAVVALGDEFIQAPAALRAEVDDWIHGRGYSGNHESRAGHVENLAAKMAEFLKRDPVLLSEIREIINTPMPVRDPARLDAHLQEDKPANAGAIRAAYIDPFMKMDVPEPDAFPAPDAFKP